MIALSDKLRSSDEVAAREIGGEIVILDFQSGEYFGLDEVGARFWQILEGEGITTLSHICDQMIEEYDVPLAELESDLFELADQMIKRGLLVQEK